MGAVALAVHVVGVSFMCGLGWFVQVVHYPLFGFADGDRWTEFHAEHSRRVSVLVGAPWAMQGIGAVALLVWRPPAIGIALTGAAVVLAGVTVLATIALALPKHGALAEGYSPGIHRRLVATNWVRTTAWTAGAVVALVMVVRVAGIA